MTASPKWRTLAKISRAHDVGVKQTLGLAAPGSKVLIPAKAAIAAAEAADFHWHIARADRERRLQGDIGFPRHWRWRVSALLNSAWFEPIHSASVKCLLQMTDLGN